MKLTISSNRNLLKIIMFLFYISFIFSSTNFFTREKNSKNSSKVKELPEEIQATLIIHDCTLGELEKIKVKFEGKNLHLNKSGFRIILKNDADQIKCKAFIKEKTGVYFLPYRFIQTNVVHSVSTWRKNNRLFVYLKLDNEPKLEFILDATYYNSNTVSNLDLETLDINLSNTLVDYTSNRDSKVSDIRHTHFELKNFILSQNEDKKSKTSLVKKNNQEISELISKFKQNIEKIQDIHKSIIDRNSSAETIKLFQELKDIEYNIYIKQQTSKNYEDIIKQKKQNIQTIKVISEEEVNKSHSLVKENLNNLLKIFFPTDPMYKTLESYSSNIKDNIDKLIPALK